MIPGEDFITSTIRKQLSETGEFRAEICSTFSQISSDIEFTGLKLALERETVNRLERLTRNIMDVKD